VKASKEANVSGNFTGDGLTFGGLLVLRSKTGDVEYAFQARRRPGAVPRHALACVRVRAWAR
jgi:hypothetical protein